MLLLVTMAAGVENSQLRGNNAAGSVSEAASVLGCTEQSSPEAAQPRPQARGSTFPSHIPPERVS
jgi:hypothetical protein